MAYLALFVDVRTVAATYDEEGKGANFQASFAVFAPITNGERTTSAPLSGTGQNGQNFEASGHASHRKSAAKIAE